MVLRSSLQAIAAEILETPGSHPGCGLELRFAWATKEPERRCHDVQAVMQENWPDQRIVQHIHYLFGEAPVSFNVSASVYFDRQVNEEQMQDIPVLCDHMLHVLNKLFMMHE
ncbi:hypothetical protein M3629_12145 [Paenibacillus polysaccharolyticus]|uniref:hypothetical protein n=1 Tax=Paenibacillus polysaccharolyticus TaxID=582692 RepID=UPI00203CC498|nr:hypothetical protein [Paenibacillus polysaccharolyticus]MCM3133551.1 hypothetical protein [Paenibacillus polysaccharolyticus]